MSRKSTLLIVIADDDADDRMLIEDAFRESRLANPIAFVGDGIELLDLLRGTGSYANSPSRGRPGLILLDLNMPRMDGRTALSHIKADPALRRIPVVVLTTSKADEDHQTTTRAVSGFVLTVHR